MNLFARLVGIEEPCDKERIVVLSRRSSGEEPSVTYSSLKSFADE